MTMTTLHDLVYKSCDIHGSEPAVVYDEGDDFTVITYDALRRQAEMLKAEFVNLGIKDTVVGLLLKENTCLPAVLLSLLSNACPFFPLTLSGQRHMEDALRAVAASHILVHQDYAQELVLLLGENQCKKKISKILQDLDLQLLCINANSGKSAELPRDPGKLVSDGLAYCITTSGTTSKPKVVRVPHTCIVPNVVQLRQIFQLRPQDKMLMAAPLTFDPSIIDIFCSLSSGACLVIVPASVKQRPERLLEILYRRQGVTVMQATPSLMRTLGPGRLQQTILSRGSRLRLLALGGEQFPRGSELGTWLDAGNKTSFYNLYGITEVSSWASCCRVDRNSLLQVDRPVPIGAALAETLIKLSPLAGDQDTGDDVSGTTSQDVGEILIGSSSRMCVIDDEHPEKSDGQPGIVWRHTGDLGTLNADSNIYCLGRLDSQVKRNGKRLNLAAVEQVLEEMPEVRSCCVIYHGTTLAAFVVIAQSLPHTDTSKQGLNSQPLTSVTSATDKGQAQQEKSHNASDSVNSWTSQVTKLQAHARHALPRHAVPDMFIEVKDRFPVTMHGKLDKQELKNRLNAMERENNGVSYLDLQDLWKTHLPRLEHKIEGCDNFLSLGGDSLAAVRLATNLHTVSSLPMAEIYDILVNKDFDHLLLALKQRCLHSNTSSESSDQQEHFSSDGREGLRSKNRSGQKDNVLVPANAVGNFEIRNNDKIENSLNHSEVVQTRKGHTSKRNLARPLETENKRKVKQEKFCFCQNGTVIPEVLIHRGGKILCPIDPWVGRKADHRQDIPPGVETDLSASNSSLGQPCKNMYKLIKRDMCLQLKWQFDTHKCVDASPLVIKFRHKSSVLIGSHSGLVSSLDLHTGRCDWSVRLPDRVEASACSSLDGQYLVVGCYDGNIHTLCVGCGTTVWVVSTGDSVKCSPAVNPVSGHVICGSHDGSLYCLDVHSQHCVWKCPVGAGSVFASPAVGEAGLCVYAATLGGHVLALHAENGNIKWRTNLQKPVFSSPSLAQGRLFLGCVDGKLYCLSAASGDVVWHFETAAPIFSSPVVCKDYVIFGSHDFSVYCLTTDGESLWSFKAQSTVYATVFPFQNSSTCSMENEITELKVAIKTTGSDKEKIGEVETRRETERNTEENLADYTTKTQPSGAVKSTDQPFVTECLAAASTDGKLYVLGRQEGQLLCEYSLPGQVFSSPVVSDNIIIVGCRDNNVYCFEVS